jgi:acyl-CoA-dependent ceramide synthase
MFTAIWIYLRHYINLRILYSITTTFATVGDFTLDWQSEQYKCWISQYITFGLLASLQSINLFWLFLILRISYNALFRTLSDVRSDDEEEDEIESLEEAEQEARNKELVDLQLNGAASATGVEQPGLEDVPEVTLNGHAMKKEEKTVKEEQSRRGKENKKKK